MKIPSWIFGKMSFKRILLSLFEIYIALFLFAWFFADILIHHPPHHTFPPLPGEITLTTSDNILISAVWIPNPKATQTILFSHGNGEDLDHDYPFLQELWASGFNVFAYDYRGYGHSKGKPKEHGLYCDMDAAYTYLTQQLHVSPSHIIVLGRSLGSGPSTYLASTQPVGGLILESGFTSAFRTAIPFPLLPFDQFPNLKRIPHIKCPVLVMHGTSDVVVPFSHGKKLFAAAPERKQSAWIEGAGHNDIFSNDPENYLSIIKTFVKSF